MQVKLSNITQAIKSCISITWSTNIIKKEARQTVSFDTKVTKTFIRLFWKIRHIDIIIHILLIL